MKSITRELNEIRRMDVAQLVKKYQKVFGKEPRVKHREHLQRKISWEVQRLRFGGLGDAAQRRLDELIGELDLPFDKDKKAVTAALRRTRKPNEPAVGTVITRTWHGQDIHVNVVDTGYEWDGVVYKSLSAVARAVTGTRWNGRLFFNLTTRKRNGS